MNQRYKYSTIVTYSILFIGMLLPIIQFLFNRSLWLDESYLTINIVHKSFFELLKPLDLKQVAPILFLQIEKLFSLLIPNSELGLRIFPLISYILSIWFFFKLIKLIYSNSYTIIIALSIFVFNVTLIYYSNEVKQYITDVLILVVMYYMILKPSRSQKKLYFSTGIIGVFSIFLSNVSPLIMATVSLYLISDIYKNNRASVRYLMAILMLWAIAFFFYYILFVHNHPSKDGMVDEWIHYRAFLPKNPMKNDLYIFISTQWLTIFFSLFYFGKIGAIFLSALMIMGLFFLLKNKDKQMAILTITPLLLHLLLSSFKLYPFFLRLILYMTPCFIILFTYGINSIFCKYQNKMDGLLFKIIIVVIPLALFISVCNAGLPIKKNEIRDSVRMIHKSVGPNDKIYVSYLSRIPNRYYEEISYNKVNKKNIIIGRRTHYWHNNRWSLDTLIFKSELVRLNKRTWFLFSNVGDETQKYHYLIEYCTRYNIKIMNNFQAIGSNVCLCDFSNRTW